MYSPLDTIKAELGKDTTSRTAAAVRAANPGMFAADNLVPPHLYKCLLEILTGSDIGHGGLAQNLTDAIIPGYGKGLTQADDGIELSGWVGDSVFATEGMMSDEPGAKISYVTILTRLHSPIASGAVEVVDTLDARVEYILDGLLRSQYKGGGSFGNPAIDPTGTDTSIAPVVLTPQGGTGGVICRYVKELIRDGMSSAIEKCVLYRVEYTRVFAK